MYADLSPLAGDFINDMVVDGEGRAYVGIRNPGSSPQNPIDTLILVQPDGRVEQVADGLSAPNGMVVTPDGATLIVAETLLGRLTAFEIGPSGTLSGSTYLCPGRGPARRRHLPRRRRGGLDRVAWPRTVPAGS